MTRSELVKLAEQAIYGNPEPEVYSLLRRQIVDTSRRTGRSVPEVARLLRLEAFAGGRYRGEQFDR